MNIEELYSLFVNCASVTTDTRNISPKSMFFALKGQNFNGNQFAEKAIESGASYAVVDEKEFENKEKGIFFVQDTLSTLQELAHYHRKQLNTPVISLTGSNGKTTTKELITQVLSKKYNIQSTKGNLNNHIGVPLTLLSIKPKHEIAIVEMGANHQKEIETLCRIAEPDFGYITNFGKAHLEGFGGIEGVIKGKTELYHYLRNNEKKVFVNFNDSKQVELTFDMEKISFGTLPEADFQFQYKLNEQGRCPEIIYNSKTIQSELIGEYNISNVAAAVSFGLFFKVDWNDIKSAIEAYKSGDNRSQITKKRNYTIVWDAYNANPSSMKAALLNFSKIDGSKRVILGDMFELGESSYAEHQEIVNLAEQLDFSTLIFIGRNFCRTKINLSERSFQFESREEFEEFLKKNPIKEENILVKGSRGMALEKLESFFAEN